MEKENGNSRKGRVMSTLFRGSSQQSDSSSGSGSESGSGSGELKGKEAIKKLGDDQLREILDEVIRTGKLSVKDRKYHLKKYSSCFVGKEATEIFFSEVPLCESRSDGILIGERMMEAGIIRHVCDSEPFKDGHYFYAYVKDSRSKTDGSFLNGGDFQWSKARHPIIVSIDLLTMIKKIFTRPFDASLSSPQLIFDAIAASNDWQEFCKATAELQKVDLTLLESHEERLLFWLNTYHALVLHASVKNGYSRTALRPFAFFKNSAYNIGSFSFSLLEIEHGILRASMAAPKVFGSFMLKSARFSSSDPRKAFIIERPEPLIIFALSAGASSSPPIHIFISPEKVPAVLKRLSLQFLSSQLILNNNEKKITCPKILAWYYKDWGETKREMILSVLKLSTALSTVQTLAEDADCQISLGADVSLEFTEYNWEFRVKWSSIVE